MAAIKFVPINVRPTMWNKTPYNLHGITATVGYRAVEVVRNEMNDWVVFRSINRQTVKGNPNIGKTLTFQEAKSFAIKFLRSTEPLETWNNNSTIGMHI